MMNNKKQDFTQEIDASFSMSTSTNSEMIKAMNGCGYAESELSELMRQYEALIKNQLFDSLASQCGVNKKELFSWFAGIRMNPEPQINGQCVISFRDNELDNFIIELYPGVFAYPWKISEIVSTRIGFKEAVHESPIEVPALSLTRSSELAKQLTDIFWNNRLSEIGHVDDIQLTARQEAFSTSLAMSAWRYVLGHECGHAVHYISTFDVPEEHWACENVERAIVASGIQASVDPNMLPTIEDNWQLEIAADLIGVRLSMDSKPDFYGKVLAYVGAEFMLMLFNFLEEKAPRENWKGSVTHPSPVMRAALMRDYFAFSSPKYFQTASDIAALTTTLFFPNVKSVEAVV